MADQSYAKFLPRLLAGLIDIAVLAVPSFCIFALTESNLLGSLADHKDAISYLLLTALWAIYQGSMESSARQATVGKMLVKVYVTDVNGHRLSFNVAAFRCWPMYLGNLMLGLEALSRTGFQVELGGQLSLIGLVVSLISCLYILHSSKNQGLHDLVSGTLVVARPKTT